MRGVSDYKQEVVTKTGKPIVLRAPRSTDVEGLWRYINALVEEETFISVDRKVAKRQEREFVAERLKLLREKRGVTLLATHQDEIIAVGQVDRGSGRLRHVGQLGISVASDYRREGVGTILVNELIRISKEDLAFRVLYLTVFANNQVARAFYRKVGFRKAGRIPKAILYRGAYVDQIFMYLPLA